MTEPVTIEILRVQILFASRNKAHLSCLSAAPILEEDFLQLAVLSCARLFHQLAPKKQVPILTDFYQRVLGVSVTPQGLKRPVIMVAGQTLLEEAPKRPQRKAYLRLMEEDGARLAEWVLPSGEEEGIAVFMCEIFFLQYLIRVLSDSSLFHLMLLLGGVLEYYEQGGKPEDEASLTAAPAYACAAAKKYVEEQRARKGAGPPAGK